jgi:hypothetical protein
MTIKALLPSPRYTGHDATYSALCNIRRSAAQRGSVITYRLRCLRGYPDAVPIVFRNVITT